MVFPFDFGYIPGTMGEDGDPLDVVVLAETKTFAGCVIDCRIIGAIKATQKERDGNEMRNDRYIAVPQVSALYKAIDNLDQLPKQLLQELEAFFINYNHLADKDFKPFKRVNAKQAFAMLHKSLNNHTDQTQLIQLFLPCYNKDGKPFSQTLYHSVSKHLTEKFKGLTAYVQSPTEGYWKTGHQVIKDQLMVYEVMATTIDVAYWQQYKKELQNKFKQQEIVVRSLAISLIK
jgi:inorganic pyrophosphatase